MSKVTSWLLCAAFTLITWQSFRLYVVQGHLHQLEMERLDNRIEIYRLHELTTNHIMKLFDVVEDIQDRLSDGPRPKYAKAL